MDRTPPTHDNILPLITQLKNIFQDKELCKRLVTCQAAAQKLLDSFQLLLDRSELEPQFRRDLIIATQRVSANSGLHPTCYTLEGVDEIGQYPEAGGSFADVYKGTFHDQQVGIKAIRLFQRDQTQHALKFLERSDVMGTTVTPERPYNLWTLHLPESAFDRLPMDAERRHYQLPTMPSWCSTDFTCTLRLVFTLVPLIYNIA
ncbi:hypothetical protein DXG01_004372 [Tephrocybe rancida]|nr:hypothetical protein DXG01_004372 [Tephrocybe rancida]